MSDEVQSGGGIPISRFDEKPELGADDAMLVSEYNPESDSSYYSDKVTAGHLARMLCAQIGLHRVKDDAAAVRSGAWALSASVGEVSADLYGLSSAFLSNDELTRLVPELSSRVVDVSADGLLRYERVVQHGHGQLGRYQLSSFAVNACRPSRYRLLRFVVPEPLPGLSRHFTVDVSSGSDAIPIFYGECDIYSSEPLPTMLGAGQRYLYDFKEIRRGCFYVRATGVNVKYAIEVVSENPEHGQAYGSGTYPAGAVVTISADPAEGYGFAGWDDGVADNPRYVTAERDARYVASFAVGRRTITVSPNVPEYGSTYGGGVYELGQTVRIGAVPSPGPALRTLTVEANDGSAGQAFGGGEYGEGRVVSIAAHPFEGYVFSKWDDGVTDNPRRVTIGGDARYVAEFAAG